MVSLIGDVSMEMLCYLFTCMAVLKSRISFMQHHLVICYLIGKFTLYFASPLN